MATNSSQVAERAAGTEAAPQQDRPRQREIALRPPVDVYEDGEGLTLQADMPGVSKDRLDVRVEGDTLVVEGKVQLDMPENAAALYADIRSSIYRRSFQLSSELETDNIQANLKDGVLQLRIPKRPELRPRRIEVVNS